MGKIRYKVKTKIKPFKQKVARKFKMSGYKGDETLRQKERADSLQVKLDSLQAKIDSMATKSPDTIVVSINVKWEGKQ